MITLCRSAERNGHGPRQAVWTTSYPDGDRHAVPGAVLLETLEECRLPPGAAVPRRRQRHAETVT
jgi:hypothetical protein